MLADPGQIEQVLMNLTVNASDAMPRGGRLTFRTTVAELDESGEPSGNVVARARRHVCLTVVDTGIGMDRETISRIFEPFFTTKPVGKGTGLGLAGVHGIVTQLGGTIWVYSEPGKGTTFKLYSPEVAGAADPIARTPTPLVLEESGTVLLVEDDPPPAKWPNVCSNATGSTRYWRPTDARRSNCSNSSMRGSVWCCRM